MISRNLNIVCGHFPVRSETFVLAHATGLARRGWNVRTIASAPGKGMSQDELVEIDALGIRRTHWGAWADTSARRALQFAGDLVRDPRLVAVLNGSAGWTRPEVFASRRMRRVLEAERAGPVHIHFGKNAALLAASGWPGPAVVTWHGFDANMLPKTRGADIYLRLSAKDWIHTVGSDFMHGRLVALGVRPDRIVKVPMTFDAARFGRVDRRGRPEGPLRVVTVGRLSEEKGHAVLIDVVSEVRRRGSDVCVVVLGEGPERPKLERKVNDLGIGPCVTFLGAQPPERVARELAKADVFALTGVVAENGSEESQGIAYIEAQATGLPVIASDVGGVSESLVPGETGILTRERDVAAVADALIAYANEPALRHEHGRHGAAFVRSRFSQAAMLDAFEDLYSRVAR